jgi:hypothetical protein
VRKTEEDRDRAINEIEKLHTLIEEMEKTINTEQDKRREETH